MNHCFSCVYVFNLHRATSGACEQEAVVTEGILFLYRMPLNMLKGRHLDFCESCF